MMNDKMMHFLGSMMMAYGSPQSNNDAYKTTLGVGAAKEIINDGMMGRGSPDIKDFLADLIGAQIGHALRKRQPQQKTPNLQIYGLDDKVIPE